MAKLEKKGHVDDVLEGGSLVIFGAGPPLAAKASTPGAPAKETIAERATRELLEQDVRNGVRLAPTPKPSSAPTTRRKSKKD